MMIEIKERPAKGRPQVSRARADAMVQEIRRVARGINADPELMHSVARVAVFGSYLGDKQVLGDLDIAVDLDPRWGHGEWDEWYGCFMEEHPAPRYYDYIARLGWPESFVLRMLKVGRGISLHPFSDLEACGFEHRIIFPC